MLSLNNFVITYNISHPIYSISKEDSEFYGNEFCLYQGGGNGMILNPDGSYYVGSVESGIAKGKGISYINGDWIEGEHWDG